MRTLEMLDRERRLVVLQDRCTMPQLLSYVKRGVSFTKVQQFQLRMPSDAFISSVHQFSTPNHKWNAWNMS